MGMTGERLNPPPGPIVGEPAVPRAWPGGSRVHERSLSAVGLSTGEYVLRFAVPHGLTERYLRSAAEQNPDLQAVLPWLKAEPCEAIRQTSPQPAGASAPSTPVRTRRWSTCRPSSSSASGGTDCDARRRLGKRAAACREPRLSPERLSADLSADHWSRGGIGCTLKGTSLQAMAPREQD